MVEQRCYAAGGGFRPRPCELLQATPLHIMRRAVGNAFSHDAILVFEGAGPRPFAVLTVRRGVSIIAVLHRGKRYFSIREAVRSWQKWEV